MGFWQGNTYVKIHAPEVVAYHNYNEQLYLAPNLKMCTLIRIFTSFAQVNPFVHDNTEGIYITFIHLADAFIQNDLQNIQAVHIFVSICDPWESNPQPLHC